MLTDKQTPQGIKYMIVVHRHCNYPASKCQDQLELLWLTDKLHLEGMEYKHLVIQWSNSHLDKVTERYQLWGSNSQLDTWYKM